MNPVDLRFLASPGGEESRLCLGLFLPPVVGFLVLIIAFLALRDDSVNARIISQIVLLPCVEDNTAPAISDKKPVNVK